MSYSITSWMRLQPRVRDPDYQIGSEAGVHDPLWFLCRQWQLGEFDGQDAGTPVALSAEVEGTRISHYLPRRPGRQETGTPYGDSDPPLEVLVEREPVRDRGPSLRLAAEAGLHFLRLLDQSGLAAYRDAFRDALLEQYPLLGPAASPPDPEIGGMLLILGGRVPDGIRIYQALRQGALPDHPQVVEADRPKLQQAVAAFMGWYESFYTEPGGETAWKSERMEHQFSVAAPGLPGMAGEAVLVAPAYRGEVDWHAFDLVEPGQAALGAGQAAPDQLIKEVLSCTPAPVRYPGMPSLRFWEMEDGAINWDKVEQETTAGDLARLFLVEFAIAYGNDWFFVPMELRLAGLYRITKLEVTDTFGVTTSVPAAGEGNPGARCRMFRLSTPGQESTQPLLFLPPVLPSRLEGPPVEEVRIVRDELANVIWAIERFIEGPSGRPIDRGRYGAARNLPPPVGITDDELVYQLMSTVPEHWLPLLPKDGAPGRLVIGEVLSAGGRAPAPLGQLLSPGLNFCEEEVGCDGLTVSRSYQYARWLDGRTYLWSGSSRGPGRGEGRSGLTFDTLHLGASLRDRPAPPVPADPWIIEVSM